MEGLEQFVCEIHFIEPEEIREESICKNTCKVISGLGRAAAERLMELSADRGNFWPITMENDSFRLSWKNAQMG